jgi:endonuclease-3
MQTNLSFGQADILRALRDWLVAAYGPVRDKERLDPVGQFVRSFLGSRIYDRTSWNAFVRLANHYPDWDTVADAPAEDIQAILADVTYAEKKAPDLKLALRKIRVRAGAIDLDFLADLPVEQALFWLEQIHGVGRKIAAATLNFSTLRGRAFVVETHIVRVMRRFGLVRASAGIDDVYDAVMAAADDFDADDLYELHWLLKMLGQKLCTHQRAHCDRCPLSELCLKRVEAAASAAA